MSNLFWLLPVFVAALGYFLYRRQKQKRKAKTLGNLPVKLPTQWDHAYNNPGEPCIHSVVPVPDEARRALAEGIRMQIRATAIKFPHWQNARRVEDYNVMFIEPDSFHPDHGFPELVISGVYSAGTVIGLPEQKVSPPNMVLPHQGRDGWRFLDYLRNSGRNEGEHYDELLNDLKIFDQYTGPNDVHPHHLLPEETTAGQARGFASLPKPNFCCGLAARREQ
jgi:hypothetical protein